MKEIGEKLKIAREEQGVSIEEAASDLNLRASQIENIEEGNLKAFKDVFYLKYFIRDYAKYLGLNEEDIMNLMNISLMQHQRYLLRKLKKHQFKKRKWTGRKLYHHIHILKNQSQN